MTNSFKRINWVCTMAGSGSGETDFHTIAIYITEFDPDDKKSTQRPVQCFQQM